MTEKTWDAIVAGAGLGGLTAAALLAKAGHRVLVLDKNREVGGAAMTYARAGRRFEASLHETTPPTGVDPKAAIFAQLGLLDRIELVPLDSFQQVRSPLLGAPVTLVPGFAALEAGLIARFPDQAQALQGFLRQVRLTQEAMALFAQHHDGRWWLGEAPALPARLHALLRDMGHSLSTVLERYFGQDERMKLLLAANLPYYTDDPDRFRWMGYAVAQGGFLAHGGSYIRGGSRKLSTALAQIVTEGGGAVICEATVDKILVAGDAVAGVGWRDRQGGAHQAQAAVVLAGIAPQVLAPMLPEAPRRALAAQVAGRRVSISLFEVSFALAHTGRSLGIEAYSTVLLPGWMRRLGDYRQAADCLARDPATTPEAPLPPLVVVDYGQIDSGLAARVPPPVSVTGVDRLENWQGLSEPAYQARKSAWIEAITRRLEAEWPGFAASVMRADMATARTMSRVLGTPGGAVYGFAPDVPAHPFRGPPMAVETPVAGLLLASAFAGFGGYSGAMGAGAMAARKALARLG